MVCYIECFDIVVVYVLEGYVIIIIDMLLSVIIILIMLFYYVQYVEEYRQVFFVGIFICWI